MKNWMLGISILGVLVCGFLLLEKDRQIAGARSRAETAEQQRDEAAVEAEQQGKKARQLQAQLRETRVSNQKSIPQVETETPKATETSRERKNPLFRDPKLRKAMEAEAKEGIEKNIKSLFKAGLAEHLHLDEGQSAELSQLLTKKRKLFWDKMLVPMMTGEI